MLYTNLTKPNNWSRIVGRRSCTAETAETFYRKPWEMCWPGQDCANGAPHVEGPTSAVQHDVCDI